MGDYAGSNGTTGTLTNRPTSITTSDGRVWNFTKFPGRSVRMSGEQTRIFGNAGATEICNGGVGIGLGVGYESVTPIGGRASTIVHQPPQVIYSQRPTCITPTNSIKAGGGRAPYEYAPPERGIPDPNRIFPPQIPGPVAETPSVTVRPVITGTSTTTLPIYVQPQIETRPPRATGTPQAPQIETRPAAAPIAPQAKTVMAPTSPVAAPVVTATKPVVNSATPTIRAATQGGEALAALNVGPNELKAYAPPVRTQTSPAVAPSVAKTTMAPTTGQSQAGSSSYSYLDSNTYNQQYGQFVPKTPSAAQYTQSAHTHQGTPYNSQRRTVTPSTEEYDLKQIKLLAGINSKNPGFFDSLNIADFGAELRRGRLKVEKNDDGSLKISQWSVGAGWTILGGPGASITGAVKKQEPNDLGEPLDRATVFEGNVGVNALVGFNARVAASLLSPVNVKVRDKIFSNWPGNTPSEVFVFKNFGATLEAGLTNLVPYAGGSVFRAKTIIDKVDIDRSNGQVVLRWHGNGLGGGLLAVGGVIVPAISFSFAGNNALKGCDKDGCHILDKIKPNEQDKQTMRMELVGHHEEADLIITDDYVAAYKLNEAHAYCKQNGFPLTERNLVNIANDTRLVFAEGQLTVTRGRPRADTAQSYGLHTETMTGMTGPNGNSMVYNEGHQQVDLGLPRAFGIGAKCKEPEGPPGPPAPPGTPPSVPPTQLPPPPAPPPSVIQVQ